MDLGLYVDAHLGTGPIARAAEDAGFSHVWVYDSPLVFGDVYLGCLEALRATSRVVVGPGVTYPHARPAHATAQALATLSKTAPGRVACGLGRGNSARHSLGARPATLDELFAYAESVRGLLAGKAVDLDGHPIRLIHPEGRWVDATAHVPFWMSVFGPKGQARARAANFDGVLVRWTGPDGMAEARDRVGDAPRLGVVFAVYPIDSDADLETEAARAALGPLVVSRLRYLTANHATADEVPAVFRDGYRAYSAYRQTLDPRTQHLDNFLGYLVFTPENLERFVTPEAMRTVCHVGSPAEVAAELDRMADAGVDHASLQMAGDTIGWLRTMGDAVLPLTHLGSGRAAVHG
jgi:alkanesulfonate monooxygenase SsuD/methylene tetrahydromethanopterin reductase-like flavin-dependent oxidoreductase (luciferase family)